jgi:hypothetical protein
MEIAMRKFMVVMLSLTIFFLTYNVSLAQNRKAPEWIISEWINGPGVTLGELKGRSSKVDKNFRERAGNQ